MRLRRMRHLRLCGASIAAAAATNHDETAPWNRAAENAVGQSSYGS
ncbi:hypothetical protein SAMN05421805_109123 [Saccharopolyspora antimicrobica]|uniref:Uncharacterized protein n=1 Tax=Saccharopolyspora antimicrobica TaxID=455193 RepID=A0A1I5EEB4_9PSEU|nr:hypothetical protein ATL45_5157 [Saccharopolyspora antimicrobica]SFO09616.1 hypothetical protein SAMN05421805_109123 [Saccharopolyspora antimicrobica]